MNQFFSTRQVAEILGVKPDTLSKAIWTGRLKSPLKSPSGSYLWTKQDIEKAAWALHQWNEYKTWEGSNNGSN